MQALRPSVASMVLEVWDSPPLIDADSLLLESFEFWQGGIRTMVLVGVKASGRSEAMRFTCKHARARMARIGIE